MTTAGLGLDVLSARVTQRLSLSVRPFLLQTGQIQPLTAGVFGESPGPGVRLTPVPLCMLFTLRSWHVDRKKEKREKKTGLLSPVEEETENLELTTPGFKTLQQILDNPVGLPKSSWLYPAQPTAGSSKTCSQD